MGGSQVIDDRLGDPAQQVRVPDSDLLALHNLLLQQQLVREQLQVLTLRFLKTPDPRALEDRIVQLTAEINATVERLFGAAGLDSRQYQLNANDGSFVKREKR
jgi:hypothetical protein